MNHMETFIRYFTALERVRKLTDEKANGEENETVDLFLVTAGSESVDKISATAYPRELEELIYEETDRIIKKKKEQKQKKKRLVVAERTTFKQARKDSNEAQIQNELILKEPSMFWEFEKLGTKDMTTQNKLIFPRIEHMQDTLHKHKIL